MTLYLWGHDVDNWFQRRHVDLVYNFCLSPQSPQSWNDSILRSNDGFEYWFDNGIDNWFEDWIDSEPASSGLLSVWVPVVPALIISAIRIEWSLPELAERFCASFIHPFMRTSTAGNGSTVDLNALIVWQTVRWVKYLIHISLGALCRGVANNALFEWNRHFGTQWKCVPSRHQNHNCRL